MPFIYLYISNFLHESFLYQTFYNFKGILHALKKKKEREEISNRAIIWRISSCISLHIDNMHKYLGKTLVKKFLGYFITLCSSYLPLNPGFSHFSHFRRVNPILKDTNGWKKKVKREATAIEWGWGMWQGKIAYYEVLKLKEGNQKKNATLVV